MKINFVAEKPPKQHKQTLVEQKKYGNTKNKRKYWLRKNTHDVLKENEKHQLYRSEMKKEDLSTQDCIYLVSI